MSTQSCALILGVLKVASSHLDQDHTSVDFRYPNLGLSQLLVQSGDAPHPVHGYRAISPFHVFSGRLRRRLDHFPPNGRKMQSARLGLSQTMTHCGRSRQQQPPRLLCMQRSIQKIFLIRRVYLCSSPQSPASFCCRPRRSRSLALRLLDFGLGMTQYNATNAP